MIQYEINQINTIKKVIGILGDNPLHKVIIDFVNTNYNLDLEYDCNIVADVMSYYRLEL